MVNFSATYTDKMPDLYFFSHFSQSETSRRQHSASDYAEIGQQFADYIQWEPSDEFIFKVNLQKVYQALKPKYPLLTLDECLSWYTNWGRIIVSPESYAEVKPLSSTDPINQLQLDYDVVVLDATPDFVENEYWTLSNQQLNDLHNLANSEISKKWQSNEYEMLPDTNDPEMQSHLQTFKKFLANPLKSIAFVDKQGHYFFVMPVMNDYVHAFAMSTLDEKVKKCNEPQISTHLRDFNELNLVEVSIAEMKHLLNSIDLLKYQDYWAISAIYNPFDLQLEAEVFEASSNESLFLNALAIYEPPSLGNTSLSAYIFTDLFRWPKDRKSNQINAEKILLATSKYRSKLAYMSVIDYLNQNLQTYYDDQGRMTFKLPFQNAVWQKHINAFTKTNPFQNKEHTVIESMANAIYLHGVFESYESKTSNAAPVSNTVLAVILNQLGLSDNGIIADLQQADAAKMQVTPLKITHDAQTPIKPLVSSSGINRILVSLAENDQHCFSVQQKQLIELQYLAKTWSGRKLNYETFK